MSSTVAGVVWLIDTAWRETMLFAAVGFLIGGIDDAAIDLAFLWSWLRGRTRLADAPAVSNTQGRLAVFVPAWDESAVIGAMLRTALARFDYPDYRLFVGCYPNDAATIEAVAAVAEGDPRVRMVVNDRAGPTTKADCLNAMWRALRLDDHAAGHRTRAVVLHDAEDVVDPAELRVYDACLDDHDLVQIPVLPLIDARARMISAHYADEFAYAHGVQLVVRNAIGAGLPLAGVGCAISVRALERIEQIHGAAFDENSLTEDYELGLRTATMGFRCCFARYHDAGRRVAVRAYFPADLHAAVVQKSRWMTGIALAGWDRIGWSRALHLTDHWMRMRDRRAPMAVLVLAIAYLAVVMWPIVLGVHYLSGIAAPPLARALTLVLTINAGLLAWRLIVRGIATGRQYGVGEAFLSVPRAFVANLIALLAARRAAVRYLRILTGGEVRWDKTAHHFPNEIAAG